MKYEYIIYPIVLITALVASSYFGKPGGKAGNSQEFVFQLQPEMLASVFYKNGKNSLEISLTDSLSLTKNNVSIDLTSQRKNEIEEFLTNLPNIHATKSLGEIPNSRMQTLGLMEDHHKITFKFKNIDDQIYILSENPINKQQVFMLNVNTNSVNMIPKERIKIFDSF